MELNEMEKKLLFQVEGDYQTKILNELYMTVRYSNNSEQREAAEGLMAKLRVLSNGKAQMLLHPELQRIKEWFMLFRIHLQAYFFTRLMDVAGL